jgi:hypothetical protein
MFRRIGVLKVYKNRVWAVKKEGRSDQVLFLKMEI